MTNIVSFILIIIMYADYFNKNTTLPAVYVPAAPPTYAMSGGGSAPVSTYTGGFVQWAGIDHSVQLINPVEDISLLSFDSRSRLFPAAELHGSLYMPEGNIIMGASGDIYLGADLSFLGAVAQIRLLQCKICNVDAPCCSANAEMNITSCNCNCVFGYTGNGCTERVCYNGGNWSLETTTCTCSYPYTADSFCSVVDCGPNALLIAGAQCMCLHPFTGPTCSDQVNSTVDGLESGTVWDTAADVRSNWGVAACYGSICACSPLYVLATNTIVERQLVCNTTGTCNAYFEMVAPYCCSGAVACEVLQAGGTCVSQQCCNYQVGIVSCLSMTGCVWNNGGCMQMPVPAYQWSKFVADCSVPGASPLCIQDVGILQAFYYQTAIDRPTAFSTIIQQLAWPQISQYDIWQDDLPHSIVLTTDLYSYAPCLTAWRLAIMYSTSQTIASTQWTCGGTNAMQTEFTFELVEGDATVAPALVGSVYRVWVANTLWCLLDRPLYPDEQYIYNLTLATPSALVILNLGATGLYAGEAACGKFIVQDGQFTALASGMALTLAAPSTPVLASTPSGQITLPPSYIDNLRYSPQPLAVTQCRFLPCQISLLRGSCQSAECMVNLIGNALFSECLPCIEAHTVVNL